MEHVAILCQLCSCARTASGFHQLGQCMETTYSRAFLVCNSTQKLQF